MRISDTPRAIITMFLILVETRLQRNCNTFTAAYADDLTAAGPIDQLKKYGMNYADLIQNLVIIVKKVNPS